MKKKDKFSPERKIDLNEIYPEEWAPQLYDKLKIENPKYYYKIYSKDEFGRTYNAMFYGCGVHIYRQLVTKREESGLYVPAITLKELNKWYNDRYKVALDFEKFRYWDLLNLFYRMTLTLERVNNNKIVTKVIKDYNKMWNKTLNAKDYFIKEKKEMKKLLAFIIVLSCFLTSYCQNTYTRNGNNFSKIVENNIASGGVTTIYTYSVNDTLKAVIHISPNTGRCFIVRTSKKTGKEYRQYLPKDICLAICKEMDIEYKEQ